MGYLWPKSTILWYEVTNKNDNNDNFFTIGATRNSSYYQNFICSPFHPRKSTAHLFFKWVRTQGRSPHAPGKIQKYLWPRQQWGRPRRQETTNNRQSKTRQTIKTVTVRPLTSNQSKYSNKTSKISWRSVNKFESEVLLWTTTHGHTRVSWLSKLTFTNFMQLVVEYI